MLGIIVGFVSVLVAMVCIYLAVYVRSYLREKADALKCDRELAGAMVAETGLQMATIAIETVAEAAVGKLEAILAQDIRQRIKNGETTKDELYPLAEEAYNEVMLTLKPELLDVLENSIENIELYIRNQIETQLLLLKSVVYGGTQNERHEPDEIS